MTMTTHYKKKDNAGMNHFRSIQDPYKDGTLSSNMYSILNTSNVESMLSGGLERFYKKYQHLASAGNIHLPTPEIHFEEMSYVIETNGRSKDDTVGSLLKSLIPTCKSVPTVSKTILHSMNGIIKPSTMTLLLGGPGSGKSTFLKAISGKLHQDKRHVLTGKLEFNGMIANQFDLSKIIGLVDQTDDHCATLTVRETLQFADICLNGRVEDAPDHLQGVAALRTELMLHLLGLENCADTVVGDAMLRGVSGGERKRVTAGEMLVGGQCVFLCDEISTGLDSASTYDIMNALRSWTNVLGGTAVVALLQPPPEVVELFDDILLLSEGYLVYHGPRTSVLTYFAQLGFECPEKIDPADFLIDVTGGRGSQYSAGKQNVPHEAKEFAECFENSAIHEKTGYQLRKGFNLSMRFDNPQDFQQFKSVAKLAKTKDQSSFAVRFLPSTLLLLQRQFTIMMRDKSLLYGKLMEAFVVGLLLGLIYLNAESSLYLRMLFFTIAVFQRQAWQQITIAFQMRSVFYKQRSRNFYRTSSYGIANALVQIPINLVVSLLMGTLFYFMSGLSFQFNSFATFITILVVFQHAIGACFTMISAISPSITVAQAFAGIAVCFFLLFSGNIILAELIPTYWSWMFWINPISWSLRSVILNEFHSSRYTLLDRTFALESFQISQGKEFIWIGVLVLFLYYIGFTCIQSIILHYIRYDKKSSPGENVIKSMKSSDDTDDAFIAMKQEEVYPGPPSVCLAVKNLNYVVPGKVAGETIQLLHDVTAYFKPGSMTALMGSSGAGKTTLLDVIAGRKTGGTITGDILVNGEAKNGKTFSRIAAYCEQMDIHSAATTVKEALLFSAHLRLPEDMPSSAKMDLVNETLELLELQSLANRMVGTIESGGLSLEERKRLTIAVEVVAQPSILFLDEPTSGLDARSALVVMRGVRSIADSGRTVICTIHQPSMQIFNIFDSLLLLQRGGLTAYFGSLGEESTLMLSYFASIPGTDTIQPRYNPATYMLEVIGAGISRGEKKATNYANAYTSSDLCAQNVALTSSLCDTFPTLPTYTQYATGLWNQIRQTTIRATWMYWRSPSYNFVRIILFPLFAIIFGTTFYQMRRDEIAKINSQIALIYNSMDFIGVINLMTVLDITCAERAVFYRERSANMYSALPYSIALFLAELPYLILVSGFFIVAEYFLVGLQQEVDSFVFFWFVFFLYISICTFLGQWMCALTPNAKVANVAVGALSCLLNLFSGYLVPFVSMQSFYKWIIYIVPSSYTLNALVSSQMGLCENVGSGPVGNGCDLILNEVGELITVAEYVKTTYGFTPNTRFTGSIVLVMMVLLIQIFIYLTFRYVNHLKR